MADDAWEAVEEAMKIAGADVEEEDEEGFDWKHRDAADRADKLHYEPFTPPTPPRPISGSGRGPLPWTCRLIGGCGDGKIISVDRLPLEMMHPKPFSWAGRQDFMDPFRYELYDIVYQSRRPYVDENGYAILMPRRD